jgi:predicted methyltransferase
MLATTAISPSAAALERAERLARELGARLVRRGNRSLAQLMRRERDDRILVVSEKDVKLVPLGGQPVFFHPGMAYLRLLRLLEGKEDPLVAVCGVQPGDAIIDCTMGLAGDAIILSWAAGDEGSVTALESERILHVLVREGLRTYEGERPELAAAMRRIRPVWADHLDYLRRLPDKSADIVYFDPMFRSGLSGGPIDRVRGLVNASPVREEAIGEARRVARRAVVMKERRDSGEWERLGFKRIRPSNSGIAYGVIDP